MVALTFTYDLEDNRPRDSLPLRFDGVTRDVLDCLDRLGARGTFFIVGTAARTAPDIVKDIAARGHEVGLHSWDHIMVPDQSPETFRQETEQGRALLQDLSGQDVIGYRAPNFSLTPDVPWVPDVLAELGFVYSSSVLPVAHPYYGYPGTPRGPFRWSSGLIEFPSPVAAIGPKELPFLGGTYFRLLPSAYIRSKLDRLPEMSGAWFYGHPHDFDFDEPFYRIRNVSWFVTVALRLRRKGNLERVERFLHQDGVELAPPLSELVDSQQDLPGFSPD